QKLNNGLNVLLEIDVQGAINVMEQNLEGLFIFIAPPDKEVLHTRLKGRGTEPQEEIDRRIAAADLELKNMNKYDHVIVNDVLETAVLEIKDIIKARRVSL
ncbi:MAG: guanylate kinase, partial [Oscillospiraceae bacterium]